MWSSWTNRYDEFRSAVELFTETELFAGPMPSLKFLAIMQALEAFHRGTRKGKYLSDKDYKAVSDVVIAAIPGDALESLRDSLKARLRFGNERSLRNRLAELVDGLPEPTRQAIHPNLKVFITLAIDTRNDLTHYPVERPKRTLQGEELYWATKLLRYFFVAVVMKDLGLTDSAVQDAFETCNELRYARSKL